MVRWPEAAACGVLLVAGKRGGPAVALGGRGSIVPGVEGGARVVVGRAAEVPPVGDGELTRAHGCGVVLDLAADGGSLPR